MSALQTTLTTRGTKTLRLLHVSQDGRVHFHGYVFLKEIVVAPRVRQALSKWGMFYESCFVNHSIYTALETIRVSLLVF